MNEYLTTFLYELANFVVFALLLGWIFIKPIRRLLDEQAAKDAKLEQTAQQHLADAEKLRQQLLAERQQFNQEMEHQRDAMLSETRQETAKLLQQANQSITAQRERLTREALHIQQQQITSLAGIVARSSQQAVERLLKQINGPPLAGALIESACRQLQQTQLNAAEKITVESADELDKVARQKIAIAAGSPATNDTIEYRLDESLVGGVRIKTDQGIIDHSIVALSAFAERSIRRQLSEKV
jgi:F0F1-type ATP synthase membrane subunit b/b'